MNECLCGLRLEIPQGKSAGAYKDVFWATYGTTTNAEIDAAMNAGKIVCMKRGPSTGHFIYTLTRRADWDDGKPERSVKHWFACVDVDGETNQIRWATLTDGTWATGTITL